MSNNREVATAIWLFGFLGWSLRFPDVRRSSLALLRALIEPKIMATLLVALGYVGLLLLLLSQIGIWKPVLVKDTIFWFLFTGIATAFSLIGSWKGESLLRILLHDALRISIIIEFLTGTYTLSLPLEMLLVPLLVLLAIMETMADSGFEQLSMKRAIKWVQGTLGLAILGIAVRDALVDWQHVRSIESLRSLILAPLLSLLFIPFVYGLLLYVTYEKLFVLLKLGAENDASLQAHAKRRLLRHFGLRVSLLRRFAECRHQEVLHVRSKADLDSLLMPDSGHSASRVRDSGDC
jgi:hypothetical protein